MQYFPTSHQAEVDNYPYGRLKCTAYFGTEFSPKHGFRSTFQTINPKNGRLNAIKKSTYYPISLLYLDPETGHYKHRAFNPSGDTEVNKALDFVREHYDLFTPEELVYIAAYLKQVATAGVHATIVYKGADKEKALEVGKPAILGLIECTKNPTLENFQAVRIDVEGLNALHVEGYNPWVIKNHGVGQ